jgi:hypothetical protein
MGDLDLLVKPGPFRGAHHILLSEGYQFQQRYPLGMINLEAAAGSGGAEYWRILPEGERLWLELQWRPVGGRWLRPDQEPLAADLMARSVSIPGTAVRLLGPEDHLLTVCLHTAKHSYVRAPGLRLHLDVMRLVAQQTINWQTFVARASDLKVETSVYFALAIPNILFGTPIPQPILDRLRPPRWKEGLTWRWLGNAGLFNADAHKFSRTRFVLFMALLYDDWRGLWKALFPNRVWMRSRYGFQNDWLLPYYHGRRLFDLAFRRLPT